jgi:hypothetical protein
MRVCVRDNLPIHPRNTCLADVVCVLLDIGVSCCNREGGSFWAVVVGSVEVAHAPFLHDELLAGLLCFLDVR